MVGRGQDTGTLLIVEDHEDTRETLRDCLEEFGYTLVTAADGAEGLERARSGDIDLIITDLNMPRLGGLELIEAIRRETLGPDVLMLSADGQVARAVEAMRLGAINYLVKPVEIDALVGEVRAVMRARRDRAADRRTAKTTAVLGHHTRATDSADRAASAPPPVPSGPSQPDLPKMIGRFQVLRQLGQGGMGAIYKCYDAALGRTLAVKVVADETDSRRREELLRRFACEAQAAGMLRHPNIVTIYDYAADPDGPAYLAMECLEGSPLTALLAASGRLPWQRAVVIAYQIADALEFAHRNQVIHRDVKPANVLVLENDVVKLLDFGIAKLANSELTVPGTVIGSPRYLSPESFRGARTDYRADQFSLGTVLYEMVAGQPPFDFANFYTGVHHILSEDPIPLADIVPGIPSLLYDVLDRLHAKDPDHRYRNEMVLLDDLAYLGQLAGVELTLGVPRKAQEHLL